MDYTPISERSQLILGKGNIAIVTGWTVKEAIAKYLQPSEYASIGQLYSPAIGINKLLRNLLFNPQVHFLLIVNATRQDKNAGGCQCLMDFFEHGFYEGISDAGNKCWVIRSPVAGYIDSEVDGHALDRVRSSITVKLVTSVGECVEVARSWSSIAYGVYELRRQKFPIPPTPMPIVFPGPLYAHRIEGETIAETWVKIIHRIKSTGEIRPNSYGGEWQELIDLVAIVTSEPEYFYFPEPNYLPCDRAFIEEYISQILGDAPLQEGVKYTYGQRLRSWFGRDQIEQVIYKLIKEPDAASAVMSLWDARDHESGSSPCLNHIWLRICGNELSLTATFRSNDMFAAWPANAMGLRALQRHVRDQVMARSKQFWFLGPLITVSQSAHIYSDAWAHADMVIQKHYPSVSRCRYDDPVGNFLINTQKNEISVSQTFPKGEVVAHWRDRSPLILIRQISAANPAIRPEHIGYLGIELERAGFAIEQGRSYRQDGQK